MKYLNLIESFSDKRILVIDNSKPPEKKYLSKVLDYLNERGISFVVADSIDRLENLKSQFNIVGAISTGSEHRVINNEFQSLSDFAMQTLNCPILGLCFGFQSMARYYGSNISSIDEKCGNFDLTVYDKDFFMFRNKDLTGLSFCFHDFPTIIPSGFKVVCELDGIISGIANESKKRYGLLFHPEEQHRTFSMLDSFIEKCQGNRIKNFDSFI